MGEKTVLVKESTLNLLLENIDPNKPSTFRFLREKLVDEIQTLSKVEDAPAETANTKG